MSALACPLVLALARVRFKQVVAVCCDPLGRESRQLLLQGWLLDVVLLDCILLDHVLLEARPRLGGHVLSLGPPVQEEIVKVLVSAI